MNNIKDDENKGNEGNETQREYLINSEIYELILKAQKEIEVETELRPTFKKMINLIINEDSVNRAKSEVLDVFNRINRGYVQ